MSVSDSTLVYTDHIVLLHSDKYEEGCINNCYTPVYPKPPPPKRDLAPRAASTPVNAWAETCEIHCGQGWQVCVELVNNGKLKLPLKTW